MTIESAVFLRRIARTACLVLVVGLIVCGAGMAQAPIQAPVPMMSGSIIPFPHGTTGSWSQVSRMAESSNGTVVFMDYAISELYQWTPGAAAPVVVISSDSGGAASTGGTLDTAWNNSGMAIDKWDNLYITDRWGNNNVRFLRAPYNKTSGTWIFTSGKFATATPQNSNWFADFAVDSTATGTQDIAIAPDPCNGGAETMYVSDASAGNIVKFTLNEDGTHGTVVDLATKLMTDVSMLAVDHAGNVYFIENAYSAPSTRVNGVRIIPACHAAYVGDSTGSIDKALGTVDDLTEGQSWKGIAVDPAGNLYLSSSDDVDQGNTYGGISDMVLMVPNEGTQTVPKLVWADRVLVSPVGAGFSVLPDSRGFLWIPVNSSVNWAPEGYLASTTCGCFSTSGKACTSTITGNYNTCVQKSAVLWAPGTLNAGSSPVATAGSPTTVFFTFNQAETPSSFAFTSATSSNFITQNVTNPWTVDPNAKVSGMAPCTAGTSYGPAVVPTGTSGFVAGDQKNYWCMLNLELNASQAGAVSGELQVLDANSNVITGSNTIVTGIGEGANVSMMTNAVVQSVATGLQAPQQVAADALGNSYVADSTLHFVKEFSAGSTSASGVGIGTGLSSPTGVAVDGVGDVYIGDKGTVYEIPFVNGTLASSQQVALAIGLGSQLNLAVDGGGHVFVADQTNKQVVLIANPTADLMLQTEYNTPTTAAVAPTYVNTSTGANVTFTGPTAIATDDSGYAYVADGGSIWQLTSMFGASQIISNLNATVTGIAVDPSGSLWLAQSSGLTWVPYDSSTGVYDVNNDVTVASGLTTAPYSVALDGTENAYVTYGSGTTAGLTRVTPNGTLDLGIVTPFVESYLGAQLFNLGNEPLTLGTLSSDVFAGTNASDYSLLDQNDTPACDPSSSTTAGAYCYLDIDLTASTSGVSSSTLTVASNAVNNPNATITSTADAEVDNRPATTTTVTVNETASVYPGNATITVVVGATSGTPDGTVTLAITGLPRQTLTLANGTASYITPALNGGTYRVSATYPGTGTTFGASGQSTTFTVATFTPTLTVGTPVGSSTTETDWQGNHYVGVGQSNTITVTVAATGVGTPTGTVRFLQNGKALDDTQDPVRLNGNGQAVFNTDNLTIGSYKLTAVYSGNTNFSAVTPTTPLAFYVIKSSVQITSTPTSLTLTPGTPVEATLTLKPLVGFTSQTTTIECVASTLPEYSECTFTKPTNIYIGKTSGDATAPTSVVVTISTNVPVNVTTSSTLATKSMRWSLAGLFGFGMLGLLVGRKRWNRYITMAFLSLMLAGGAMSMTACTNAGYSTPPSAPKVTTPSGTYNVQIITLDGGTNEQTSLTSPAFTLPVTVQ